MSDLNDLPSGLYSDNSPQIQSSGTVEKLLVSAEQLSSDDSWLSKEGEYFRRWRE